MRRSIKQSTERGLSLIEMVIAILVLSIGIMAAFKSLDQATMQIGGETARVLAATAARNRAEELTLLGPTGARALADEVTLGPFTWHIKVDEEVTSIGLVEATIQLTSPDQPGAVLVVYVAPEAGQ